MGLLLQEGALGQEKQRIEDDRRPDQTICFFLSFFLSPQICLLLSLALNLTSALEECGKQCHFSASLGKMMEPQLPPLSDRNETIFVAGILWRPNHC